MVARNDITGDAIQTKGVTDAYRNNFDLIFGKKKKTEEDVKREEALQALSDIHQELDLYDELDNPLIKK